MSQSKSLNFQLFIGHVIPKFLALVSFNKLSIFKEVVPDRLI